MKSPEQVEALRDETIRQLETRCRAYESVLSGRQRRKVEALLAEGDPRSGTLGALNERVVEALKLITLAHCGGTPG